MGGSSLALNVTAPPKVTLYPGRAVDGNLLVRRLSPHGTVMTEADLTAGVLTIWADQLPHPDDWADTLRVLGAMNGPPIGVPELDGEFDVWTIPVDFRVSTCPVTSTVAALLAA